jgi:hypothetical protein
MKERSLLYFLTAVILSTLLLVSIVIKLMAWYPRYGEIVAPSLWLYIIPLVLVWVGWYFESKGFLLSTSILTVFIFILHANNIGLLSGNPYILSMYAPIVKSVYVVTLVLLASALSLGFYTYLMEEKK